MTLISIVIPCRNEEKFIDKCLDSVAAFTLPPNVDFEAFVVDGASEDRTVELVEVFARRNTRFRLLRNPRRIQSTALNLAVRVARGRYIMRLDAHTTYPSDYLSRCYETAERTAADNVGGVCITAVNGDSYQAQVVQALTTHRFGVGNSGFRTGAVEGPRDTVPFGFFKREIFTRLGGFDERLVRCQDYEFNRRIVARGGRIWLNPAIQCTYFNQPYLWPFLRKQTLMEAPYNPYMWYLAPYSFALRHAITGLFAVGVLLGAALMLWFSWVRWIYLPIVSLYAVLAVLSALQQARRFSQPRHALMLPFCFFAYHFLHGLGVVTGIVRLLTRTAPVQRAPEPWSGENVRKIGVK